MAASLLSGHSSARVLRIEVSSRTDVLDGRSFGDVGPYEKIIGKIYFSVDPALPANKRVVDLDNAPKDAAGRVTFSSDLYAIVPKDLERGNGSALFDVLNRGRKNIFRDFNGSLSVNDPLTANDLGNGFLMKHGFSLIWVGWQFDIPSRDGLMGIDVPVAEEGGKSIVGRISTSFIPGTNESVYRLDDLAHYADATAYPPLDPSSPVNTLTEREGFLASPQVVARSNWCFGSLADGELVDDVHAVHLEGGFKPGHVYELSYDTKGGHVAGLGFVALRDVARALKSRVGLLSADRVYAFGPSQDGRFLRQFLYEGFNEGEDGGRAFDGLIVNIAGAARGNDFDARFARPNGLAFYEASLFPYLDSDQTDSVSGKTDGLLSHLSADMRPKIFYTNSSGEYWGGGRAAALIHTTLDGTKDATPPETTRVYLFAGTQHLPGGFLPSQGEGANGPNHNDYGFALRALLLALDRWVKDGTLPPQSRYPRLDDRTLVKKDDLFDIKIPGLRSPLTIPAGYRADLKDPTRALPLLVPQVDADGNEIAGIRLPNVSVPLGTYTGWNFRHAKIGQPTELLPLTGSYVPFAPTRAAREATDDPRRSIEERYASKKAYLHAVRNAAGELARAGYVLTEDGDTLVDIASRRWDAQTGLRQVPAK